MKVVCIVQARMGSSRLPGKVLKRISDKTILEHVISRIKQSKLIDDIVIATTIEQMDNVIEELAIEKGIKVFRGSEQDVLSRYYYAARDNNADVVIRVTSDCPLIDCFIIDQLIEKFLSSDYDIVTNATSDEDERTYPRGLDAEVFSFDVLEKAFNGSNEDYQREHVTPYIYENSHKKFICKSKIDYSRYRWTLDTNEDLELISKIYEKLYFNHHDFYLDDIIKLFENYPNLQNINKHVKQKQIK